MVWKFVSHLNALRRAPFDPTSPLGMGTILQELTAMLGRVENDLRAAALPISRL